MSVAKASSQHFRFNFHETNSKGDEHIKLTTLRGPDVIKIHIKFLLQISDLVLLSPPFLDYCNDSPEARSRAFTSYHSDLRLGSDLDGSDLAGCLDREHLTPRSSNNLLAL